MTIIAGATGLIGASGAAWPSADTPLAVKLSVGTGTPAGDLVTAEK